MCRFDSPLDICITTINADPINALPVVIPPKYSPSPGQMGSFLIQPIDSRDAHLLQAPCRIFVRLRILRLIRAWLYATYRINPPDASGSTRSNVKQPAASDKSSKPSHPHQHDTPDIVDVHQSVIIHVSLSLMVRQGLYSTRYPMTDVRLTLPCISPLITAATGCNQHPSDNKWTSLSGSRFRTGGYTFTVHSMYLTSKQPLGVSNKQTSIHSIVGNKSATEVCYCDNSCLFIFLSAPFLGTNQLLYQHEFSVLDGTVSLC